MEYYITQPKDYWIAENAVSITLNALGNKNRIQGSVASGAVIMCFVENIKAESAGGESGNGDGLWYGSNHEPKRWPLTISPTYFNSDTRKYVYVAIPRSTAFGTQAVVVFPSEQLDIYGRVKHVSGGSTTYEQVGSEEYFYVYLSGIIGAADAVTAGRRDWEDPMTNRDWGVLETAQGREEKANSSKWYTYSEVTQVVTFLKEIVMNSNSSFRNLILNHKSLTDVATSAAAESIDSDTLVATPNYVSKFYLSKTLDDTAAGHITFSQGFTSVVNAIFGQYARGQQNTGAAITPEGLGDFLNLKVIGQVLGSMTVQDTLTAVNYLLDATNSVNGGMFRSVDRSGRQAAKGFTDGRGIVMDAGEGLIETDGLNVRGFMRIMELIINKLQLMTSDYSFTEGGTIEHVSTNPLNGVLTLTMHKEHDNDLTPFDTNDIVYAKVNNLLEKKVENADHSVPDYYTVWMRVTDVDRETNSLTAVLYDGMDGSGNLIVPGGRNFSPCGTEVTGSAWYADGDYDCSINITRHGNVTNTERQQAWVLSTTDKRLSFFWGVDKPIIEDRNYALCLGILPDLANLPSTRDRSKPSLYVDSIFYDHKYDANFPAKEVKEDRGQWTDTPTAEYNGQTVSDPYHYRHINQPTWLTYRAMPAYSNLTDEQLLAKINAEFKADLETSRVWQYGILWECLTEATTEEPGFGCQHWQAVAGETMLTLEPYSTRGDRFRRDMVNTEVRMLLYYGQQDITSLVDAQYWTWTRSSDSGKTAQDEVWDAQHRMVKSISLRSVDMPQGWSSSNRAIFTCTVQVNGENITRQLIA